ncbi:gibberellin 20 oxidase 2 [Euphorbia peplus]|nr:gibberellin 20 oxidase 2 [Euphorbia peplus]
MSSFVSAVSLSAPQNKKENAVYEWSLLREQSNVPTEFFWPKDELVKSKEKLSAPVVDLEGFFRGDAEETLKIANLIRSACLEHGFFQVINHGVDIHLINKAQDHMDNFFKLPTLEKLKALKIPGSLSGYSSAHSQRFTSKLPWKEMLSFHYYDNPSDPAVLNFFMSKMGKDFEQTGMVYQKYCEAMQELALSIMEIMGISLGVDRMHFRKFYEDGTSLLRCNQYPPCQEPDLTLGTGPHADPNSITILHQDQVGGLEVFSNNEWKLVEPVPGALVINIGDTFQALSNGIYKSCMHRAVVNRFKVRKSMAFFVSPREDKVVSPPESLVSPIGKRIYPDFIWSQFVHFTQNYYRVDGSTLNNFITWLTSNSPDA